MSENETKSSAYEKLTPQRKQLVDQVLANLEKGNLFWTQGWVAAGAPESAVTGKKYRGINNLYLSLVAMAENYGDNRWATFRQMEEKGWTFKKDEEGHTLGKGKSVSVEYYEMRDKETKRRFDRSVLDGMTFDEQREYMDKNVYWLRKFYRVFNCSLMDGVPAKEMPTIDVNDRIEKAEAILDYWNANESKIVYGGSQAFYRPSTDEVHLPEREKFKSTQSFYDTAFHEIGHSTGHQSRLNRDLSGGFGSQSYAMEELRAEIASIFMAQDLGIEPSEDRLQNNAAYIQSWKDEIKENPNALFTAIADADKIARYVSSKEQAYRQTKDVEYYAIVEETNAYSEQVYRCYICDEEGKVKPLINYGFADRDALEKELDKIKELDLWKDKTFEEVGIEALKAKSEEKEKAGKVEQEKSTEYIRPSELVAAEVAAKALPVSMDGRGLESLTRMSDRETLSRAETYYGKDGKFSDLYHGKNVLKSEEESEYGLMVRLAMFCGGDQDRLLRVFRSSGQYREEKPNAYYEKMAENSLKFISDTKRSFAPMGEQSGFSKGKQGINSKRQPNEVAEMIRRFFIAINVILFLLSLFFLIKTATDKKEINRYYGEKFSYTETAGGEVELEMSDGETVRLRFDKEVVKAEQSYRVKDRAGQIYLTTFIYSYAREKEIHIERKFTDMLGELRLHNALYAVGYKREQTADADLDFTSDKRWYVNFISTIF